MPASLTQLRRLAQRRDYAALEDACLSADSAAPGVQVLLALAHSLLGEEASARNILASLDHQALDAVSRVDLAAVYHNLLRAYRDSARLTEMTACLLEARRFGAEQQEDWPDEQRRIFDRQLRGMQLDLWLQQERVAAAEAWIEGERGVLCETAWCTLLSDFAERLAARNRHAHAEELLRAGVRRYPDHQALHVQLAELAHLQGRPLQAVALLRRAIRLGDQQHSPTDLLWARMSAIALGFDPRLAREAAARAKAALASSTEWSCEALAERRAQVELALAGVETQQQDYSAAEQRYLRLLEQRPDCSASLLGMGQLFMQLGRIDAAIALFERVAALDPARGHGALINARRFPEDDATLHRLEQLARENPARIGLLYQLAAAWEKRRDYAKAFGLADEANAATRRLLRYDPRRHRDRCARIRHAFPKALFEHRSGSGHDSTLPVFVVGMPRSGTTLVEQVLAGHSRIHGAGELDTIPRVIAGLERWERHTGSGRCYPDCVDDLDPQVSRGIAEGILRELREYAPEADHVVDKLPHNFENIGLIRLLFPRAKVISVRRDPRDIAVSNYFTDYAAKQAAVSIRLVFARGLLYSLTGWEAVAGYDRYS